MACKGEIRLSPPKGTPPTCGCRYQWKNYGRLYGIDMGDGWVRMDTAAECTEHTAGKATEGDRRRGCAGCSASLTGHGWN